MKYLLLLFLIANLSFAQTKETIKWYSFNQVDSLKKLQNKKVFLDVFTDWCGWCKKMDASTFTHPVIVKLMNKYFFAVKFDAETAEVIKYNGNEYKKPNEKKQTPNEFASFLLNGKMSYPTTVYLDESLNSLGPVPGYLEPKTMEKILHFFWRKSL